MPKKPKVTPPTGKATAPGQMAKAPGAGPARSYAPGQVRKAAMPTLAPQAGPIEGISEANKRRGRKSKY